METGTPIRTLEVGSCIIDEIYEYNQVDVMPFDLYPNQGVILKSGSQSVVGIVTKCGNFIKRVHNIEHYGIKALNKEQMVLQSVLDDPEIRCIVVTGAAGTGKTICVGAYALESVLERSFHDKLVLSKPLEIVTRSKYWGTVPGNEDEKFAPFIKSFELMFDEITAGADTIHYMEQGDHIEFLPLELMRGASLSHNIVWFDEAQNLNLHEMETLGSRINDRGNSKLIVTGDTNQLDSYLKDEYSGLSKMLNSSHFKQSRHCAHVHLCNNERGEISQLFFDIFHN